MIIGSLPAAASNSDCRRRSHPDCRATVEFDFSATALSPTTRPVCPVILRRRDASRSSSARRRVAGGMRLCALLFIGDRCSLIAGAAANVICKAVLTGSLCVSRASDGLRRSAARHLFIRSWCCKRNAMVGVRHRAFKARRARAFFLSISCRVHVRMPSDGRDQGQNLALVSESPADHRGQIMKILNSADLFAPPKRQRNTKDWFERAKLVVAATRDRAVKRAQQRAATSMERPPTVLQRHRLAERLSARS